MEDMLLDNRRRDRKWCQKQQKMSPVVNLRNLDKERKKRASNKIARRKARLNSYKNSLELKIGTQNIISSNSQIAFEKKVLEFLSKFKEVCPKIFKKLEKLSNNTKNNLICSGTQNGTLETLSQNGMPHGHMENVVNFLQTDLGRKFTTSFMDKFFKTVQRNGVDCLERNIVLSENFLLKSLQKLDEDYEMEDSGEAPGQLSPSRLAVLALPAWGETCKVEELD